MNFLRCSRVSGVAFPLNGAGTGPERGRERGRDRRPAGDRSCPGGRAEHLRWPEVARGEGYRAVMEPGISSEDCLYADLGIDPGTYGCQHFETSQFMFYRRRIDPSAWLVLWQVGLAGDQTSTRFTTGMAYRQVLVDILAHDYPLDHEVVIYRAATLPIQTPRIDRLPLKALPHSDLSIADTLAVPPSRPMESNPEILARLTALDLASSYVELEGDTKSQQGS